MENTVVIHHRSEVTAEGKHINGNSKSVFCITTGMVYASVIDAAVGAGVVPGTMSFAVTHVKDGTTCKGKRYCFTKDIMDHLEEISQCSRAREAKVQAYDAIIGREEAKRKANERRDRLKASCDKLRDKLAREMELLAEADEEILLFEQEECYA